MGPIDVAKSVSIFLEKLNIKKEDKILLSFSGGKDSLALLKAFSEINQEIEVVYLNHNLRKEEDLKKEEELNKYNAALFSKNLIIKRLEKDEVKSLSKRRGKGIEDAARVLRYQMLEEVMKEYSCKYIATAHTLSDLRETILIRLKRKEFIFSAIKYKNKNLIRPLLDLESSTIINYIKDLKPSFDKTNNDKRFLRNSIREDLKKEILNNNLFDKILASLLSYFMKLDKKREDEYKEIKRREIDNKINIEELKKFHILSRFKYYLNRLNLLDETKNIKRRELLRLDKGIKNDINFQGNFYKAIIKDKKLKFEKRSERELTFFYTLVDEPKKVLYYNTYILNTDKVDYNSKNIYFCDDLIKDFLIARSPLSADRIKTKEGFIKISKILKDQKIDKNDRAKAVILCDREQIIALILSHIKGRNRIAIPFKQMIELKKNRMYSIKEEKNGK